MKKFYLNIVTLCLSLWISNHAVSQEYIYQHFTTADGLPSSEVYHVFQDSKGYIWFATDNGVSRYNGYEFENFDMNDGLPVNSTSEIYEDFKGRIWFIGMNASLSYYKNGKIYKFKYNKKLSEEFGKSPTPLKSAFYIDKFNVIYISLEGYGLYSIDSNGAIDKYDEAYNFSHKFAFHHLHNGKIMPSILRTYYKKNIILKEYNNGSSELISLPSRIPKTTNHFFILKQTGSRYLCASNSYLFELNNGKIEKLKNFEEYIIYFHQDKLNNLWVCFRNGGVLFIKDANIKNKSVLNFLPGQSVSSVMIDSMGGTWFTTLDNGIFYLPTTVIKQYTTKDGLISNNINCIEKTKESIWIGYNSATISKKTKTTIENFTTYPNFSKQVNAILTDTIKKTTYLGTPDYIYAIDASNKIDLIKNNHKQIPSTDVQKAYYNVSDLLLDKECLWISGGNGFYKLSGKNTILDSRIDKNFQIRVGAIYKEDSTLWLGTESGLWSYRNEKLKSFGNYNPLLKNRIIDIKGLNGQLILATKGSGILIFDGKNVKQIRKSDGLNNNTINSLQITDSILWSGSVNGLNRTSLKLKNKQLIIGKSYQVPELMKFEIHQIIFSDDNLYLATNKGLVVYNYLYQVKENKIPLYLTKFTINNLNLEIKKNYTLNNNENNLTICFEALDFASQRSIEYKYLLKGLENKWIYTKNRSVNYYHLHPGQYTFIAKAKKQSGNWTKNTIEIKIHILPAIWKTFPFKMAIILISLSIFLLLLKAGILSVRDKASLKKNMQTYMMQALVGQMNPHFIFNTLNSINKYILTNEKRDASIYLTKFSKLIRKVLENSRNEYISLSEEISALELYLEIESLRLKNKFQYSIDCTEDINIYNTKIPSLIIQPFIENAIWHGIMPSTKYGIIKIKFSINENSLIIEVVDNGIGRTNSLKNFNPILENKKSLGSKITNSRLSILSQILKKDAKINYSDISNDKEQMGTKVTITLPLILENRKNLKIENII